MFDFKFDFLLRLNNSASTASWEKAGLRIGALTRMNLKDGLVVLKRILLVHVHGIIGQDVNKDPEERITPGCSGHKVT